MEKINKTDELLVLKATKEMLKSPIVYEAFLMMMGAVEYLKNMPVYKNKDSNHLDLMVFETDKYADQKIQKLRHILKQNGDVRKKMVKIVSKECSIYDVSYCLNCLEENLGVASKDEIKSRDLIKKANATKRGFFQTGVQVKS